MHWRRAVAQSCGAELYQVDVGSHRCGRRNAGTLRHEVHGGGAQRHVDRPLRQELEGVAGVGERAQQDRVQREAHAQRERRFRVSRRRGAPSPGQRRQLQVCGKTSDELKGFSDQPRQEYQNNSAQSGFKKKWF